MKRQIRLLRFSNAAKKLIHFVALCTKAPKTKQDKMTCVGQFMFTYQRHIFKVMYSSLQELLKKEEKSVSILSYTAESSHNGLNMTCKAYNQKIHYDYVEDSVPIVVHCKLPYAKIKINQNFLGRVCSTITYSLLTFFNLTNYIP